MSLDCEDPVVLAEFWARMLGGEVVFSNERTVAVQTPWVWIAALRVDDHVPPSWPDASVPKHLHLDLAVEELEASVAEAISYGAVVADHQPSPDRFQVLLDPAGHPFCLWH